MIDQFISEVKSRALAQTNRYMVEIYNLPGTANPEMSRLLRMFCNSVSLPGISFEAITQPIFGEDRKFTFDRSYGDLTLSFLVDKDMTIKSVFDNWAAAIINPVTREVRYQDEYVADMSISVLDKEDKIHYVVKAVECFPISVSDIALSNESKETMSLEVTMAYKYWTALNVNVPPVDRSVTGIPAVGVGDPAGITTGGNTE